MQRRSFGSWTVKILWIFESTRKHENMSSGIYSLWLIFQTGSVCSGGRVRGHTRINSWEVIASDVDQLQQFGEQLPSTGTYSRNLKKKANNLDFYSLERLLFQVLTDLVPQLEKRIEREERKMRAAARLRKHECNIILDLHGGYGRPARARNEAKYTFEDYERAMAEAIDEGIMESDSTDAHASPPADTDDMSLDRPPEASTSFQQDVDTPDPLNNAP